MMFWAKLLLPAIFTGSMAVFAIAYGSKKWVKVKYMRTHSDKITGDPLRILHISDLHGNHEAKMNIDIWRHIDKMDVDMAVITGDVILDTIAELTPHIEGLKRLATRVPVFYVDGNHDVFYYREIRDVLAQIGVNSLFNDNCKLRIRGQEVQVVGLQDFYHLQATKFLGVRWAFRHIQPDTFTLVLSHQPQLVDRLLSYSWDLLLCGHTHGGQVRLPFFPTLFAPYQGFLPKYGDGWFDFHEKKMYISRGIGTTHFPIRFFNRPELAVILVHNGH